jgi:hypothetical protein
MGQQCWPSRTIVDRAIAAVTSSAGPIKRTGKTPSEHSIDRVLVAHDETVTTPLSAGAHRARDGAKKIARILFRAKSKNFRCVAGDPTCGRKGYLRAAHG